MLLTSKLISQLLLPPGGLILSALVGLFFWTRWWGRALIALTLMIFWALSTEPVRDALSKPLEFAYPALELKAIDTKNTAIILLGGGIYTNAPEYAGADALRGSAIMRTSYASYLSKHTNLTIYATGGNPLSEGQDTEANVMQRWLISSGVDEKDILTESHANNTWQNAIYMKNLLSRKHIQRIILVTSAWHIPRSVWCFESQGLEVIAAPSDYITSQKAYDVRSYMPNSEVFSDSSIVLHEYLGLLWYYIKYG